MSLILINFFGFNDNSAHQCLTIGKWVVFCFCHDNFTSIFQNKIRGVWDRESASPDFSLSRKARTKYSSETHFFFFAVLQMLLTNVDKVSWTLIISARRCRCGGRSNLIIYPLTKLWGKKPDLICIRSTNELFNEPLLRKTSKRQEKTVPVNRIAEG